MTIGLTRLEMQFMRKDPGVDEKTRDFVIDIIEENNRKLEEDIRRLIAEAISEARGTSAA